MAADRAAEVTQDAARDVGDHPVVQAGARIGYAVSGMIHVVIGWIAGRLALGGGGGSADQSGALTTLADNGPGRVMLWVAVTGFVLLAVWQVSEAVLRRPVGERLKASGTTALYLALGWSAFGFARGQGSSSRETSVDVTARLMAVTMGRLLVALVGVGVLVVGVHHVYKGWSAGFVTDLRRNPGRWAVGAGRVGYAAKGIALVLVGVLLVSAARHGQAGESTGLDGALRRLLGLPYGRWLLLVVAVGLAAFGVYCGVRARLARL